MNSGRRSRKTRILDIRQPGWQDEAAAFLGKGGVLAYPTETVYGLGCDAFCMDAVARIIRWKGRSSSSPFLVLVADIPAARALAASVTPAGTALMDRFWPGPLTLIMEAGSRAPTPVIHENRIAVRVSSDPVCRQILEIFRRPLVSTSANPGAQPPARDSGQVLSYFPRLKMVIDGGVRSSAKPSTLVDVSGELPIVMREGCITGEIIMKTTGELHGPG